jgi:hypothetical protein
MPLTEIVWLSIDFAEALAVDLSKPENEETLIDVHSSERLLQFLKDSIKRRFRPFT